MKMNLRSISNTVRCATLATVLLVASPAWAELRPVPTPSLVGVTSEVRERVAAAQQEIDKLRAKGGPELAEAYGQLGMLYLHFSYLDAAEPCFFNAASLASAEVRWRYYLAVTQERAGNLAAAAGNLQRVLSVREGNLPAVLRLAGVSMQLGEVSEAEILYQAALQSPLGLPAGEAGLAQIASDRGEHSAAVGHYLKALEAQPEATALGYRLGLAYRQAGNEAKAKEYLANPGGDEVRYPDPLMIQLDLMFEGGGDSAVAGSQAVRRGDFDQAIESFREALESRPEDLETRRSLALTLTEAGQLKEAQEQYEEIIRRDPSNASAYLELGSAKIAQSGNPGSGIADMQKAVELAPDFQDARGKLARAMASVGRMEEALPHFESVVAANPRDTGARLQLGQIYLNLGRGEDAKKVAEEILRQEPGNLDGLLFRGTAFAALSQPAEAEADFARVADLSSATLEQRVEAAFNLALLHQAKRDIPKAVEQYRRTLALDPNHRRTLFNLAVIMASNRQLDDAIELYQRLFDLDPENPDIRFRLAVSLMNRGDHWPALGHFEALYQAHPEVVDFSISSALLLAEVGQVDQAAERLLAALAKAEEKKAKSVIYGHLAAIEIKNGKTERGLGYFRKAVDFYPEGVDVRRNYAQALANEKRFAEAAKHYEAYIALVPEDEKAHFAHATALIFADRFAEARDALVEVTAKRSSVPLTHLLARLLATAPDPAVRNGERAVQISQVVFNADRNPAHGETMAMAMAAAGRFEEALALQKRLLSEAEAAEFNASFIERVKVNLARYEQQQVAVLDW